MIDINKISQINRKTDNQDLSSVAVPRKNEWDNAIKQPPNQQTANAPKTMQVRLDRMPQNLTNQNGQLSPQQMAQHLSRELARRTAQSKATRSKGSLEKNLGIILDESKELRSLLGSGDEGQIASFLAFFQSEMEKHLEGMEFGEIIYDQELIDKFMSRF